MADWPVWEVGAIAAITLLGLFLRLHNDTLAPVFTDNADDVQFTWLGLNLIVHGDAYSWSYFPGYAAYTTFHDFGTAYPMVHHWMDHPPLFGYVMGGWVWLLGDRSMLDVTPAQVKVPPVIFSSLTIPLLHALGRQMIDRRASLAGALLLATGPGAVLMGREAEPEALQAVLLLGALLLTLSIVERGPRPWQVGGLLVCCLAAPQMKVSGIAIPGICLVVLLAYGHWRLALATGGAGVAALLLYALYGWIVDWQMFLHIFGLQAANRLGVMSAFDFIADPTGINRRLRDGWWILGWIGLGLLLARRERRRELFLVWPAFAYAATMLLLAGEHQIEQYGWYKLIIYPEVYLGAGYLAWVAVRRASIAGLTVLLALGGATATNWWLGGLDANWVPDPALLVVLAVAVVGPAVIAAWRRELPSLQQFAVWVGGVALAFFALGNTVESLILDRILTRM